MPPFETMDRHDKVQYWPKVKDDLYGKPVVSLTERSLMVRWVETDKLVQDKHGNVVATQIQVVLGEPVEIGSVMRNGGDYCQVVTYNASGDLKGIPMFTRMTASLMKIGGQLPTQA